MVMLEARRVVIYLVPAGIVGAHDIYFQCIAYHDAVVDGAGIGHGFAA